MIIEITEWMDEVTGPNTVWYLKRLSGNDTLATGSHQAGPYIPKEFFFTIFPSLNRPGDLNPDKWFDLSIDSHAECKSVRAIWYNNKMHGGTRNEARFTNFGGQASPLLDPESTGSLTVFAFVLNTKGEAEGCRVWVCRHETEEDIIEDRIGPVEPGAWEICFPEDAQPGILAQAEKKKKTGCWLELADIPPAWLAKLPTGLEIIQKAFELSPCGHLDPDYRLMKRRDCEYKLFKSLEEAIELPLIQKGFGSIDEFVSRAQAILQRRKSRSGRSLELHVKGIFIEEGMEEGKDFSYQPESDPGTGKTPDFLFPSGNAYQANLLFPEKLRMLAVKTTCKDRWRQILNEADKIEKKHLLTIQEGVSELQFKEMSDAGVQLVVPSPLVNFYPKNVQPYLQSIESFIGDMRLLQL